MLLFLYLYFFNVSGNLHLGPGIIADPQMISQNADFLLLGLHNDQFVMILDQALVIFNQGAAVSQKGQLDHTDHQRIFQRFLPL